MSNDHKKDTHKREMVVSFVDGFSRTFTLKGDLGEMEESVISHIGESIRENGTFFIIDEEVIVNSRTITAVTFGPVKEIDGA